MRSPRALAIAAIALLAPTALAACGDDDAPAADGRLTVAVAFSPLHDIATAVGGDEVQLVTIVPPGQEAHEYEPTAQQLTKLQDADVVFYLGRGFQPGVERALDVLPESVERVDLLDGLELLPIGNPLSGTDPDADIGESLEDGADPHVWLDPTNMSAMSTVMADTLSRLDSAHAADFAANAADYGGRLDALDQAFHDGLADCQTDVIVTGHRAFAYLAHRYGLTQVSIGGITPEIEPTAKTLEAVADFAEREGVTTIFFEENLPDDLSRTVADEIGVGTAVLDPVESLSKEQLDAGATYISVMQENLSTLRTGLRCT